MIWGLLIIWTTIFLFWFYVNENKHKWDLAERIPGPKGYPVIGNALLFWGDSKQISRTIASLWKEYKRMFAIWIGPSLNIVLFDPKDIEVVLKATKNIEKAHEYRFWKPFLGDGLIVISGGAKFRQNKRLIMPSFQLSNLKGFFGIFNEQARALVNSLKEHVGKEFNVSSNLSLCTMNILMETILGLDKDTLGEKAIIYNQAAEKLGKIATARMYKFWLRPNFIFNLTKYKREQDKYLKIVNDIANHVIQERRRNYECAKYDSNANKRTWSVFLDSLIAAKDDDGMTLSDQDIRDEVMTILFAGQDTTSLSLGYTLSLLGLYHDVQDKLVEEINSVLGDDPQHFVTYDDIKKMEYMDRVIQETWRLYPSAPIIGKRTTEDVYLDDCVLPRNCTIAIIILFLHRNPKYFPNPHKFDPDNFLPERIKSRHPCSFIPFSAGYRTCIGQRYAHLLLKVVLAILLSNYRVVSKTKEKHFVLSLQTTLKRKDGFQITLEPRRREEIVSTVQDCSL